MSQATDFATTTPHRELRQTVNSILDYKKTHDLSTTRDTHSEFVETHPKLFEKLMEDKVDMEQLNYILKMYENVQKKRTPFEAASKQIGQRMFDQYVKPDLPPPSDTKQEGIQFGSAPT
jgi:hypothetical protein